jgi:ectoine hydroxylase-related dioxygenase (phytanoyl-CoA dioxygenase family)
LRVVWQARAVGKLARFRFCTKLFLKPYQHPIFSNLFWPLSSELWRERRKSMSKPTHSLLHAQEFRFHSLHLAHERVRNLAFEPAVFRLVTAILGGEVGLVQAAILHKGSGCAGHQPHQDAFYIRADGEYCITVWVALDEAGPANGGIILVPNSHKTSIVEPLKLSEMQVELSATAKALSVGPGTAVYWHGGLVHWSATIPHNVTTTRRALVLSSVSTQAEYIADHLIPALNAEGLALSKLQPFSTRAVG